jgi:hypothetical protein
MRLEIDHPPLSIVALSHYLASSIALCVCFSVPFSSTLLHRATLAVSLLIVSPLVFSCVLGPMWDPYKSTSLSPAAVSGCLMLPVRLLTVINLHTGVTGQHHIAERFVVLRRKSVKCMLRVDPATRGNWCGIPLCFCCFGQNGHCHYPRLCVKPQVWFELCRGKTWETSEKKT